MGGQGKRGKKPECDFSQFLMHYSQGTKSCQMTFKTWLTIRHTDSLCLMRGWFSKHSKLQQISTEQFTTYNSHIPLTITWVNFGQLATSRLQHPTVTMQRFSAVVVSFHHLLPVSGKKKKKTTEENGFGKTTAAKIRCGRMVTHVTTTTYDCNSKINTTACTDLFC